MRKTIKNRYRGAVMKTYFVFAALIVALLPKAYAQCETASELLQEGQQAYQEVDALGFAWRATQDHLDAAEAEIAAGDCARGSESAQRAIKTARAAMQQALTEQTAWQARLPTLK